MPIFPFDCNKPRRSSDQSETHNSRLVDENPCSRISKLQTSSEIVENILDIGATIIQVLCNCGIHPSKTQKALDVIVYSFIHFEEVRAHPSGKCKKRIRRSEFINSLMTDAEMTKSEAKMTYSIAKAAFKAFYEQQVVNKYDAKEIDACQWNKAVDQTIGAYMKSGASKSETDLTGQKILSAYQNYLRRLRKKNGRDALLCGNHNDSKASENGCNCQTETSLRVTQSSDECEKVGKIQKLPALTAQLTGEYCNSSCLGQGRGPLVVKDCQGRVFLMIQENHVYFDPKILNSEAKRATRDMFPDSESDCYY